MRERLLDLLFVLLLFALVSALGVGDVPGGDVFVALVLAPCVAALLALLVLRRLRRRGRLERLATAVQPFAHASRLLVGRAGAAPFAATAGVALLDATGLWLIARAVDIDVDLLDAVFLLVLVTFVTAIPAAPGFVGTFDGALLFGLTALDVPGGPALAYVILVRFVFFVPVTLVGAAILLARYGGFRGWRRQPSGDDSAR